eukprot:CAMPEP_0113546486 /NCGR_PEP_ID=MMETSP0015_2-20120614/11829_1 /TAXON_ID=2838 /ORGANISM="Odontella" /LENGTH=51 /DNA_ID=CAMNT_0000446939 /DNA_START=61 /DNA_END=212 /DNA_ORIENTATION=+ /assembly_acc=CAM_ASM_000160
MRTSTSAIVLAACCVSAAAFAPAANRGQPSFVTQRNMFSGAGDAAPKEDDP